MALQINVLDPEVLRDAQEHPADYRFLVRITGYNAYFTSIGRGAPGRGDREAEPHLGVRPRDPDLKPT